MKRAIFLPPLVAAIAFTVPQALEMYREPSPTYLPVVYELLMLAFSYAAALAVNGLLVLPLAWLQIRLLSGTWLGGLVFGLVLAFIADVVAYAFEIFDYQPSIFHPAYLYTVFVPLLCLCWLAFLCLARRPARVAATPAPAPEETPESGEP